MTTTRAADKLTGEPRGAKPPPLSPPQGGTGAVDGRRSLFRASDINPLPCLVLEAALAAWSAFSFSVVGAHERMRGSALVAAAELWVAASVVLVMLGSLMGESRRAPARGGVGCVYLLTLFGRQAVASV